MSDNDPPTLSPDPASEVRRGPISLAWTIVPGVLLVAAGLGLAVVWLFLSMGAAECGPDRDKGLKRSGAPVAPVSIAHRLLSRR